MPDFEQHPIKALVEGIISLVLLVEGVAFPGWMTLVYSNALAAQQGKSVCLSGSGASMACTESQLAGLLASSRVGISLLLVFGLFYFGASILLGALARKYAIGAGKLGKAKVGFILGGVGFIGSIALLAILLILGILFLAKLA